ncbi:MAG TPA: adenylate/guanylate cyclase domain-containing protein [Acidimicrobiales bacterium]|nr:adenylate/guanylate cyclase domain-containing protein [Acidimicrobiales bacterium]
MATTVTKYAQSGDLSIAYQVHGEGPIDLVFVPGFVTNLDVGHELANVAGVVRRFGSFARLITFDKRGTGLSDRTSGVPTLAERMDDIRAVMDAASVERAAVIGMSEGSAAASVFAATFPERVSALVLWVACLGPPLEQRTEMAKATIGVFRNYIAENWGDGTSMRFLMGTGAPHDAATDELFARYERNAATPSAALAVLDRSYAADCRPIRDSIMVPTLLVGHLDDLVVPIELVRETAAGIAHSRLVELSSPGHWSWDIAEQKDLDVIEEFLTGAPRDQRVDRVLATVLYTDIVDSTERAFRLGDRRWSEVLDAHDALTRRELRRFGGQEVNTTGDGFIAVFDGPARAVECAQAIVRAATAIDVDVRAGLHTGECEARGSDFAGVTMHIGARVAALAGARQVLVSRTVRDLVDGSGIRFEPRGEWQLKGVPHRTELYAAIGADL